MQNAAEKTAKATEGGNVDAPAPGVRRLLAPNAGPMTGPGTNTYLVGERAVAVIDPGPDDPQHLDAILAATDGGSRIEAIFVTHAHLDHTALAQPLADRVKAPILGFGPHGTGRSAVMARLDGAALGGGEGADASYAPDIAIADGETARSAFGAWRLTAHHSPGHTSDHMCFSIADAGVLFSGDLIMGWATTLVSPPDGDMGAYFASLDALSARRDRLYLPGHGDPVDAPHARVDELRAHRRGREAQILAALEGQPATARALVEAIYTDVDPRMHGMAARNVLAHLIDLWERGEIAPQGPFSAEATFEKRAP